MSTTMSCFMIRISRTAEMPMAGFPNGNATGRRHVHYLHFPVQLEGAPKGATLRVVDFEVDPIGGVSKSIAHLHIVVPVKAK
jgi:hypothetical protein